MRHSTSRTPVTRHAPAEERASDDPHIPVDYVYALWEADHVGTVLEHLTTALQRLGGDVERCVLVPPAIPQLPEQRVWQYPLSVDPYTLYVIWRTPPASPLTEEVTLYIEMACRALDHLLTFRGIWPHWARAVDRVEAPLETTAVLDELVAAFHEDLGVPHVRLFRFQEPDTFGFLGEATAATPLCHLQPDVMIPTSMMPTAYTAVETGDIQWYPPTDAVASEPEEELLFPVTVTVGLVVPFWLSTREMGVITLGWDEKGAREKAQTFTSQALRFLLHHAALALERADLHRRVTLAYREAALMMDHVLSGILLASSKLRVVRANPAAARLWRLTPSQMHGRHLADLFGETFLHVRGPLLQAQQHGQVGPIEWTVRQGDDVERHLLVTVVDVRGQAWPEAAYLISVWDITELHRVEQLKQRILAGVSHEMRTPLAVIKGYAEVLHAMGSKVDHQALQEGLTNIIDRATELEGMINLYLDLLHLEGGQYVVHQEVVHLDSVLTLAVDQLRRTRERIPEVAVEVAEEVHYVQTDPRLLWHIVYQLLSNAVKFTPVERKVEVVARAEADALHLAVRDEGPGISQAHLTRLFDKFYQGEEGWLGVEGSGLGLAMVKAAVSALDGVLRVESEPGAGTTFHVVLPAARVKEG